MGQSSSSMSFPSSPSSPSNSNSKSNSQTSRLRWTSSSYLRSSLVLQSFLVVALVVGSVLLAIQINLLQNHVDQFSSTIDRYITIVDNTYRSGARICVGSHHCHQHGKYFKSTVTTATTAGDKNEVSRKNASVSIGDNLHYHKTTLINAMNVTLPVTLHEFATERLGWSENDIEERIPLLRILQLGDYKLEEFLAQDDTKLASLPKWTGIMNVYGPPKIWGLQWCEKYQQKIPPNERRMGVAGAFDSGTNLLYSLLEANCKFKQRSSGKGIEWQVPWGKHYPVQYRNNHTTKKIRRTNKSLLPLDSIFTVTVIRDPMTWMQSMCRQSYTAQFDHDDTMCPNVVPYPEDIKAHPRYAKMSYMPVHTKFDEALNIKYESIAHMWNLWYGAYLSQDDDFPRLVVRLEDLLFHADEVVPQICTCAGGSFRPFFRHSRVVQNRNKGIDTTKVDEGLYRGIVRYGNTTNRRKGYPSFQLEAIRDILDPSMMDIFGYPFEEPSRIS